MWAIIAFGRMGQAINMGIETRYITKRQAKQAAEELSRSSCYTDAVQQLKPNPEDSNNEDKNRG